MTSSSPKNALENLGSLNIARADLRRVKQVISRDVHSRDVHSRDVHISRDVHWPLNTTDSWPEFTALMLRCTHDVHKYVKNIRPGLITGLFTTNAPLDEMLSLHSHHRTLINIMPLMKSFISLQFDFSPCCGEYLRSLL